MFQHFNEKIDDDHDFLVEDVNTVVSSCLLTKGDNFFDHHKNILLITKFLNIYLTFLFVNKVQCKKNID
jgi:hypothetical protein